MVFLGWIHTKTLIRDARVSRRLLRLRPTPPPPPPPRKSLLQSGNHTGLLRRGRISSPIDGMECAMLLHERSSSDAHSSRSSVSPEASTSCHSYHMRVNKASGERWSQRQKSIPVEKSAATELSVIFLGYVFLPLFVSIFWRFLLSSSTCCGHRNRQEAVSCEENSAIC